jgi:hypothetical protein
MSSFSKNFIFLAAFVSLALAGFPRQALAAPCDSTMKVGDECTGKIAELHPTQPQVGRKEVNFKIKLYGKMRKKDPEAFEKLKKEKIVPVVIGPDENLYLVDHHHTSLALWQVGEDEVYMKVQANWSKMLKNQPMEKRMKKFWQRMEKSGWAWLEREDGTRVDPLGADMPHHLAETDNSRIRGLVWKLLQDKHIEAQEVDYYEFMVGKYLNEKGIAVKAGNFKKAYNEAVELVKKKKVSKTLSDVQCLLKEIGQ